jgi:Ca2+-binding EF-hand superfamily protein
VTVGEVAEALVDLDVNADGEIESAELVELAKRTGGALSASQWARILDVDGDGHVDWRDAVEMFLQMDVKGDMQISRVDAGLGSRE